MVDIAQQPQTADHRRKVLEVIQGWLPVLTAVVGALWGLYVYIDHENQTLSDARAAQQKEANTRRIEAQKPLLDRQLALYFETAQVAGRMLTTPLTAPAWDDNETRFWQLYWSELSLVENQDVERAMLSECMNLLNYKKSKGNETDKANLEATTYVLAHVIRDSIRDGWSGVEAANYAEHLAGIKAQVIDPKYAQCSARAQ